MVGMSRNSTHLVSVSWLSMGRRVVIWWSLTHLRREGRRVGFCWNPARTVETKLEILDKARWKPAKSWTLLGWRNHFFPLVLKVQCSDFLRSKAFLFGRGILPVSGTLWRKDRSRWNMTESKKYIAALRVPSREWTYPTWGSLENHRLKSAGDCMGYVNFPGG